jgi:hypothetical protein
MFEPAPAPLASHLATREDPPTVRPSILVLPLLLSLAGCKTAPPVSPSMNLPPDTAAVCSSHCNALGMDLGAVVIVRDSAGCVCQPRKSPPSADGGSAAVMGGVVAVMDAEEADEQSRQRSDQARQQRERSQSTSGGTRR